MADAVIEPASSSAEKSSVADKATNATTKSSEQIAAPDPSTDDTVKPTDTNDEASSEAKDRLQTTNWSDLRNQDNANRNGDSERGDRRPSRGRGGVRGGHRGRGGGGHRGGEASRGGSRRDHLERVREYRDKQRTYAHNVKSDMESQPTTDDPHQIRKQVEFYFSDSNLPTDNFLLSKSGGSQNKPIPVSVIHSFKRMRRFQPYTAVVAALRDSETLNIVGKDGEEEIQRKTPLPDTFTASSFRNKHALEDTTLARTIYAKGFDAEGPSTQFDIEAFFAPYGPTNAIRLRRNDERVFKRSVFVEFETDDGAREFLEMETKPKWQGADLVFMSKKDYVDMKKKEIQQRGSSDTAKDKAEQKASEAADEDDMEKLAQKSKKRAEPSGGHDEDGSNDAKQARQDTDS